MNLHRRRFYINCTTGHACLSFSHRPKPESNIVFSWVFPFSSNLFFDVRETACGIMSSGLGNFMKNGWHPEKEGTTLKGQVVRLVNHGRKHAIDKLTKRDRMDFWAGTRRRAEQTTSPDHYRLYKIPLPLHRRRGEIHANLSRRRLHDRVQRRLVYRLRLTRTIATPSNKRKRRRLRHSHSGSTRRACRLLTCPRRRDGKMAPTEGPPARRQHGRRRACPRDSHPEHHPQPR